MSKRTRAIKNLHKKRYFPQYPEHNFLLWDIVGFIGLICFIAAVAFFIAVLATNTGGGF